MPNKASKGGKGKKKKDPEKEAAKQARKAQKAERAARKRDHRKVDDDDDASAVESEKEGDLDEILAEVAKREAARTEITVTPCDDLNVIFGRCNCTLTACGKELFVFGGERRRGDACVVHGELYRMRKERWARIASPKSPPPRCAHVLVEVSGKLLLFGGEFANLTQFKHFNDLWSFDPKTLAWEERRGETSSSKKPSPRSGHRARSWRGQLLMFGGFLKTSADAGRWHNDLWVYAPARNEWTEIETASVPGAVKPPPRSACVVAVADDKFLVWGGYSETKCDNALKAKGKVHVDAWQLDLKNLTNGRWDRVNIKGEAPSKRAGCSAAQRGDAVYVFGGVFDDDSDASSKAIDDSTFYNDLFVLDAATLRWSSSLSSRRLLDIDDDRGEDDRRAPAPRIGAAVAVEGKSLYVAGGILEVRGDRERTFDDLWATDVSKKKAPWTCVVPPSKRLEEDFEQQDDDDDDEKEEEEGEEDSSSEEDASATSEDTDEEKDEEKAL